jgi:hypothetical protein
MLRNFGALVSIGSHKAGVLESYDDAKGSATLAASLPKFNGI